MALISIITPTYNRAYCLPKLYESLEAQTVKNFEWVVIDDGSTDNTRELCTQIFATASFPCRYAYQINQGKHVALNKAAELVSYEWVFIVDSDDTLTANAMEINAAFLKEIAPDRQFAGVSGLCSRPDGNVVLGAAGYDRLPKIAKRVLLGPYLDATPFEYRHHYRIPGDRAEIIRTDILRQCRFPSFQGENFLSEYYLWQSISDRNLKIRWFNSVTYICDYLPDGLTQNMRVKMRNNPQGRSWEDAFALRSNIPFIAKIRHAINYLRYGKLAGHSWNYLIQKCPKKNYLILAVPVAFIFRISHVDNISE